MGELESGMQPSDPDLKRNSAAGKFVSGKLKNNNVS
jgi:hypothetical protein